MSVMRIRVMVTLLVLTVAAFLTALDPEVQTTSEIKAVAGKALDLWFAARTHPEENINMEALSSAFRQWQLDRARQRQAAFPGTWESIGPMNFGGRLLCLAFNPQNPNTLYAGSASGGLWRSHTGGVGANAWEPVPTGFPVIGVAAIAFHPADSNILYLGTGEVYNYQNTGTGFNVRTTRGTYGIGILKSLDAGATWSSSLNWQYSDLRGVQDLVVNPLNPFTVFAATTEGTFRSLDAGTTWVPVHGVKMATDLDYNPADTSVIFVAAGNLDSPSKGIYKSIDGGSTFVKLTGGLPASYTGKTLIAVSPSQPQVMYASMATQYAQIGLYRSDDYGVSWVLMNTEDVAKYQGWYSHDVAVRPDDSDEIIFVGIDAWKSSDAGTTLTQKSYWYNWDFSATPVGGPEGPPDYVHADIHQVIYHPVNFNKVYYATDGGLFISNDGGETFAGANGRLHCQQFYADFSCSASDSLFGIGGLQDNATPVYEGNLSWRRVIGGDGLSTAINPLNDNEVYGSYQYLNIRSSTDKAQSFNAVSNFPGGAVFCFAGPYVLSPSSTNTLYAGGDVVFKSTDAGNTWLNTNGGLPLNGDPVLKLAISSYNPQKVIAATAPLSSQPPALFRTVNGGGTWTNITGSLPNRYILDVAIDPVNDSVVYVALGGFGTSHVFKSVNSGDTWMAVGAGLADVPANTVAVDPLNTQIVYAGNDLGVFVSLNGGMTFQDFNDGLYDATMIFDISLSPSNRMLRLATHGKGAYERYMLPPAITSVTTSDGATTAHVKILGNPFLADLQFEVYADAVSDLVVSVFNVDGKKVLTRQFHKVQDLSRHALSLGAMPRGMYLAVFGVGDNNFAFRVVKQ